MLGRRPIERMASSSWEFIHLSSRSSMRRTTCEGPWGSTDIKYPVALDNDFQIWRAFENHYWPALYFVDSDGVIRDEYFGEGRYEESEAVIQDLLGTEREPVPVVGSGVEAPPDWDDLSSPETYLGLDSPAKTGSHHRKTKAKTATADTGFPGRYD